MLWTKRLIPLHLFQNSERCRFPFVSGFACNGRNNPTVLMEFFVLSAEMQLKNSIKRIIDYDCQVFFHIFFFFSLSPLAHDGVAVLFRKTWEWVKSGPWGPVRDDISWLHGSKTNTQTCPGASALHLPSSRCTEVIQLCPSTFVFVYPYCRQSLI